MNTARQDTEAYTSEACADLVVPERPPSYDRYDSPGDQVCDFYCDIYLNG